MNPLLLIITALWLHYFWSLVPVWRFGEYYSYGFFVPAIFFALGWRRYAAGVGSTPWKPGQAMMIALCGAAIVSILALVPLRIVETGDPGWRPTFMIHGLVVVLASHLLLALDRGWKGSAWLLPVTLIAWSAVPYLGRIEQGLVRGLTGTVISLTREIFILSGYPVEMQGERLALGNRVVEVTGGCSGIRSIQSLLMSALFFGELLWLRWHSRLLLLAGAMIAALLCNTARAYYLSYVQFFKGHAEAEQAHDPAGHVAFAVSALLLYLLAASMIPRNKRRMVIRHTTVSNATPGLVSTADVMESAQGSTPAHEG